MTVEEFELMIGNGVKRIRKPKLQDSNKKAFNPSHFVQPEVRA